MKTCFQQLRMLEEIWVAKFGSRLESSVMGGHTWIRFVLELVYSGEVLWPVLSQFYPIFPFLSHEIPLNINAFLCIFRWPLWWSGFCSSHVLTLDSSRPRVRNCGCTYIYLIIIFMYLPDIWFYSFQTENKYVKNHSA